jgi:hypothetical protein
MLIPAKTRRKIGIRFYIRISPKIERCKEFFGPYSKPCVEGQTLDVELSSVRRRDHQERKKDGDAKRRIASSSSPT